MTPAELLQARKLLGYTQAEMARALGFTRQAHISDLERGKYPITDQTARLVRYTLAAIVKTTGQPAPRPYRR